MLCYISEALDFVLNQYISKQTTVTIFFVKQEQVTQCNSVDNCHVFNRFWTMEVYGTEEYQALDTHTYL